MPNALVVCPFCGCGCSFYLESKNERVVGVTPSREHSISGGSLCAKGWNAHEFVNHPERITSPMIRHHGIFREATWDEALDLVSKGLTSIKEEHGSDALAFLSSAKVSNEENYVFMKLARATFNTNNVDHCARL
jgi:predicted molibdopterin-dependent oxidoreductase YjgC